MMLTTELVNDRSALAQPVVSVYCQLLPVSAEVRGTSVPAGGIAIAGAGIPSNNTDMGAVAFVEGTWRGLAGGLKTVVTSQPGAGLNRKRHGDTRGRPPREHLRGLQKPDRTSRGRDSRRRESRPYLFGIGQVAKPDNQEQNEN